MDDQIKDMDVLMVRFLQGTCTKEEKAQFLSWLNDDSENEISFFQMKEIFDTRKRISLYGKEIKKPQPDRHIFLQQLLTKTWMRYAAIVAVIFGVSSVFYFRQNRTVAVVDPVVYVKQMVVHNTRGVYIVTFPDGSKVWLHGATTITYPERFSDSIRMVDLQGEAYFAVQADKKHPFVVQTPTAKVRATGTEFNITAYPGDHLTTTTLVKGAVDIQPNHLEESVRLKPGQQAMVGQNDSKIHVSDVQNATNATSATNTEKAAEMPVIVQEINTDLYTDWKDGIYRFKNEPFHNIVLRLEKMYGVEIHIDNEDLKKATFSGMFTTDYSLKDIFEIINISNPISYSVKDKVVSIRNKKIR